MALTNKGKANLLSVAFRGATQQGFFYAALTLTTNPPTVDTETLGELDEVAQANGYVSGGTALSLDASGFPTLVEDDALDLGYVQLKQLTWTATGGSISSTGSARYLVLTGAGGVVADREVWAFWDIGSDTVATTGQSIVLNGYEIRLQEV